MPNKDDIKEISRLLIIPTEKEYIWELGKNNYTIIFHLTQNHDNYFDLVQKVLGSKMEQTLCKSQPYGLCLVSVKKIIQAQIKKGFLIIKEPN